MSNDQLEIKELVTKDEVLKIVKSTREETIDDITGALKSVMKKGGVTDSEITQIMALLTFELIIKKVEQENKK